MQVLKRTYHFIFLTVMLILANGCVEEIDFITETFESVLVIDATITNEVKTHTIKLSRSYRFEEEGPFPETGATVQILSDTDVISFIELSPGAYSSSMEFKAMPAINYQLEVMTSDGRTYSSDAVQLAQESEMDNLYAVREDNDDGINSMSMYVDSYDPSGNSKFYRYEFEETYKIIAPKWVAFDMIVINDVWPDCDVKLVPKTIEKRICYGSNKSVDIIQTNTTGLSEDRVSRFLVHQIHSDDFKLTTRYSILVKQYIQSLEAYTYFETLNEFTGEGSLFSSTQPGFFNGNVLSNTNLEEKVIGFFDVSSVSEERIFFNFADFYMGDPSPPFVVSCGAQAPLDDLGHPADRCGPLLSGLQSGSIVYYMPNENDMPGPNDKEGPYLVVARACGDCTILGENVAPNFWEE